MLPFFSFDSSFKHVNLVLLSRIAKINYLPNQKFSADDVLVIYRYISVYIFSYIYFGFPLIYLVIMLLVMYK